MTVPNLLAAVCGLQVGHPELVTLIFDIPVTSAAYLTGLSMRINGASLPIASAAQGTDSGLHQVVITLSGGPVYTAALDVSYNASLGDWHNGSDLVVTFTQIPVVNGSVVGRPPTNYPLSSIRTTKIVASGGGFTGSVTADLNMVDANLCTEYAPQLIDFGGTYNGVLIPQNLIALVNGLTVSQTFSSLVVGPAAAALAATQWETAKAIAIGNALATLRTLDAGVSFGADTITQY